MDSALFDYALPPDRIAATPAARRDASRLLVVRRAARAITHHVFRELPDLLPPGTVLFRNNARVLRARLPGLRPSGGRVECLLLRPAGDAETWWCLLKPGKKTATAGTFSWPNAYRATVLAQEDTEYRVHFDLPPGATVTGVAEKTGALPLPPYIEKARLENTAAPPPDADYAALDRERYQTLYADPRRAVAAAAPTAGLHFSEDVLARLARAGHASHDLTLHIGPGTFQPIKTATVEAHAIHREFYEIPPATLDALAHAARDHRPRLAVGTTSLRALEDFARKQQNLPAPAAAATAPAQQVLCSPFTAKSATTATSLASSTAATATAPAAAATAPYCDEAALFIRPPDHFAGADLLLTNFHLPRSTLMCLVSAFLTPGETHGITWLKEIYATAIAHDYRFYSYGDAMLILP